MYMWSYIMCDNKIIKSVCAVRSCLRTYAHSNTTLFRFPKDSERCKQWATACKRLDLCNQIDMGYIMYTSSYRVCGIHFEVSMFTNAARKRLHQDAIPTLYLDNPDPVTLKSSCILETVEDIPSLCPTASTAACLPPQWDKERVEVNRKGIDTGECSTHRQSPCRSIVCTQTEQNLSARTPRKEKLRRKIKTLQNKIRSLEKQLDVVTKANQEPLVNKVTREDVKNICEKYIPHEMSNFVLHQFDLQEKCRGGRRYSTEFKYFCLKLYFLGPKCYSFLESVFNVPSRRTLSRLTQNIKLNPGISDIVFRTLKLKVDTMEHRDKLSVICFDEMSIQSHMYYNITEDEIVGFEDIGNGKTFHPALNVLVIMIRGIFNNWKQPLAYFFINTTCKSSDLKNIVFECISKLHNIGLSVKAVVSDMGSSNIKLSNSLGVTIEAPYFKVENNKIVYIFDPPHLIKATRNNLFSNNFVNEGKVASWKHIQDLYNIDKKLSNKLAPKLTDAHLCPTKLLKMKVSLATQLLSASVANALGVLIALGHLSTAATETQMVIEMFDNLFDIFNSNNLDSPKPFNRAFQGAVYQLEFLNTTLRYLKTVHIIDHLERDITRNVKFLKCWQITINALLDLWIALQNDSYDYLLTRRLSQDPLENFFATIRRQGGCCVNPTPIQFTRAFKKSFALKFLNSGTENCCEDHATILSQFEDFQRQHCTTIATNVDIKPATTIPLLHKDYHFHDIERNSVRYICGYLIRKCLDIHSCDICEKYGNAHSDLDETSLLCSFKAYQYQANEPTTFGTLYMPHDNFFVYICALEEIFKNNFENIALGKSVLSHFLCLCSTTSFTHPCNKFPYSYLLKLYSRMRLYYSLKFINKNFKTINKSGQKTHRKIIIWRHD